MKKFKIPSELIEMLSSQRLIPFIGAGFSAGLNLPDWENLLRKLSDDIEGSLPYDELKKFCNNDPLQIAEYYYLKSDNNIGPLRHVISNALRTDANPVFSGAHVDLVNLGCRQIYTTNFDDLIERTYKILGLRYAVVALPKDVATSTDKKFQIIKYHGDLRHESTLVLTESSYYERLDFESPMDLKFRSDLLGRSVLFMGYSFRDINIRVIWFKLMQMMKDIPTADRPNSYIVRFTQNPALELLYDTVGIKTIYLDEQDSAKDDKGRARIFNEFLFELTGHVSQEYIPGTKNKCFLSMTLIDKLLDLLQVLQKKEPSAFRRRFGSANPELRDFNRLLNIASKRIFLKDLKGPIDKFLEAVLTDKKSRSDHFVLADFSLAYAEYFGSSNYVTALVSLELGREDRRGKILDTDIPWDTLWGGKVLDPICERLIKRYGYEIDFHGDETSGLDEDLAYQTDILMRMKSGFIVEDSSKYKEQIDELISRAREIYPSIGSYEPISGELPNPLDIIAEIDARNEENDEEDGEDHDIPF